MLIFCVLTEDKSQPAGKEGYAGDSGRDDGGRRRKEQKKISRLIYNSVKGKKIKKRLAE